VLIPYGGEKGDYIMSDVKKMIEEITPSLTEQDREKILALWQGMSLAVDRLKTGFERDQSFRGIGECAGFNVYVDGDGTKTNRGTKLTGVIKVELPKIKKYLEGYRPAGLLRLDFAFPEYATPLLERWRETCHIEVRAAAMFSPPQEEGYCFHGHRYIVEGKLERIEQAAVERQEQLAISLFFRVRNYSVWSDGKKLLEAGY